MSFLYPSVLWALLLIAIPIIIHLFNFRRAKRIAFPSIRFLRELQERKASRSRLRHLLSLILRCLAIAAIVIAFAQPGQERQGQGSGRSVSIYLDNSYSMRSESSNGELLELAKNTARDVIKKFKASDEFQILDNEFSGRSQRLLSQEEALLAVDEVSVSVQQKELKSILERQSEALEKSEKNNTRLIISDFQSSLNIEAEIEVDSRISTFLSQLLPQKAGNIYIDTAWFETPVQQKGKQSKLVYRLVNSGEGNAENIRVSLSLNGQQKALSNRDVEESSQVLDTMLFEIGQLGWVKAELSLKDAPIDFDDKYFISFEVMETIPVLVISQSTPNKYLKAFFSKEEFIQATYMRLGQLDYSRIKGYNCIILDGLESSDPALGRELSNLVNIGANVVLFPAKGAEQGGSNSVLAEMGAPLFQSRLSGDYECRKLDLNDPIFQEVFQTVPRNLNLPSVSKYNKLQIVSGKSKSIIHLNTGDPFLLAHQIGNGRLYICASALDENESSFPKHSLFIPSLYRMILLSASQLPLTGVLGSSDFLKLPLKAIGNDPVFELRSEKESFIPRLSNSGGDLKLGIPLDLQSPGFYDLVNRNRPEDILGVISLNLSRTESVLKFCSPEDLKELSDRKGWKLLTSLNPSDVAGSIDPESQSVFWKFLLIAALVFLLLEVIVLRFFS